MESAPSFERRSEQRYGVALQATINTKGATDRLAAVACTVVDLSHHGVRFESEHSDLRRGADPWLEFNLPDGNRVEAGVRVLHERHEGSGTTSYSGPMLFADDRVRKRLKVFLKGLGPKSVIERRKHPRRLLVLGRETERRRGDRRRHLGIFTESMAFAMRAPRWRSTYTYYQHVDGTDPGHVVINGRRLISYSSKDYLGLAHDPRVKEASVRALERYGTSAWSRVLNGTIPLHEELERELADYKGTETALLFPGGYVANVTILGTLLKPGDVVFLDEHVHVSLVEGSRSAGARIVRFQHNSMADLVRKIERIKHSRRLIIVDGVYSVEGDVSDLPQLRTVADRYHIPLLVDDAHGVGVLGRTGSGTPEHFGLHGKMEIEVASFSAAFAGVGAFIACGKEVADYLLHFSNGIMFTTSLAPATLAGALEALRIMRTDTERRERLWSNVRRLRQGLDSLGYRLCSTASAVMSIEVGNEERTYALVRALESRGVSVNAFRRPAVNRGEAKLRMSVSSAHSLHDIDETLDAFSELRHRPWFTADTSLTSG